MALTCGFYNSKGGDRRYNAIQMSSIFDGIIKDGIFMSIGTSMKIKPGVGMTVIMGEGRAWFNHSWTLNDAEMPIDIDRSEVLLNRIDSVVLDIDAREEIRDNTIKVIKGAPSSNPVAPALINTSDHHQYPLCDVYVGKGVNVITAANITNRVGTGSCPFITGILQTINIDSLIAKWESQWNQWFAANQNNATNLVNIWTKQWTDFFNAETADMLSTAKAWNDQWNQWFQNETSTDANAIKQWQYQMQQDVAIWFAQLQAILEPDVAVNITNGLLSIEHTLDRLATEQTLYRPIFGSDGDKLLDSNGLAIEGQTIFALVEQLPFGGFLVGLVHDSSGTVILDNLSNPIKSRTIFVTE